MTTETNLDKLLRQVIHGDFMGDNPQDLNLALEARKEYEAIKNQEPEAMRHGFDGYGYSLIDNGSGSDWQTRHKDGEPLFTAAGANVPQSKSAQTWCQYVAGILGTYLKEPCEGEKVQAMAKIIERRLWALPPAKDEAK